MAGQIPAEVKSDLKQRGVWEFFLKKRESLQSSGYEPGEARDLALEACTELEPGLEVKLSPEPPDTKDPAERVTRDSFPQLADSKYSAPTALQEMRWVAETWGLDDVSTEDAPSINAWFWREQVRQDKNVRQQFYRDVYPKLLPTTRQLEAQSRTDDDASTELTILDEVQRISEALREQANQPEPETESA